MKIIAKKDCKACHGSGLTQQSHPYGSTSATETLYCDCVGEQIPEDYDGDIDIIEPVFEIWLGHLSESAKSNFLQWKSDVTGKTPEYIKAEYDAWDSPIVVV